MKNRTALLLTLTLLTPLFSANPQRIKNFHRFLISLNTMRYPHVLCGKIEKIIPNGYRKNRRRFDVLKVRITTPVKGTRKNLFTHLLYHKRNFRFKESQEFLFFITKVNRLSYIDPPHPVRNGDVIIDKAIYPLKSVIGWCKNALAQNRRRFLRNNRRFFAIKRTRDRKAGFRLKMLRKELLLLYKINKPASLMEKISFLIELGHTRIRLGEYKKAENAFLYVRRKFKVAPIVDLLAARGLALTTFHTRDRDEAIRAFRKLLTHPAAADGYRAVIHLDLGRLYETSGKTALAIAEYSKAAAVPGRYNEQAFARFNLGEVYRKKGLFRKALSEFKKAYRIFNRHLAQSFRKGNTRFPTWYFVMKRRISRRGK